MVATYDRETATPTHRAVMTTDGVSRASVLVWGPTATATTLAWFDADRAVVAGIHEHRPPVASHRLVAGDGGTYAFVDRERPEFDGDVFERIAATEVAFLPPMAFREDGTLTFEVVGERTALSRFYESVSVTVTAVETFDRYGHAATLTDRQRAALEAAADTGYYDCPRTGSVADVADRLDCAHSTAGELLRRAESAVVGGFLDHSR